MLETLDGLGSIDFISLGNGLIVQSNDILTSIGALSGSTNMTTSSFFIDFSNNPLLTSIDALLGLQGELILEIDNCDTLIGLSGLENFTSTIGIVITDNENLADISALSSINDSTTSWDFIIARNPSLNNLEGLEGITEVMGIINIISDNDILTSLDGFQPTATSQLNI